MLNLETYVTPNHFNAENFEQFGALSASAEFDLIAPILVYFHADLNYRAEARTALLKLKKLKHPMVDGLSVTEMLETAPKGLVNRYNALVIKVVNDLEPTSESYIDAYGAFGFRLGENDGILMGDSSGLFAFYLSSKAIAERWTYVH